MSSPGARDADSLTPSSYLVLGIVDWLGKATAYEIKKRNEQSVANFWPVPRSQVYAEAARLAGDGYMSERQEQSGRRRKVYSLTAKGRRALKNWLAEAETGAPELRSPALLKLFFGADPAAIAPAQHEYHRAKMAELQSYAALGDELIPPGVRRALAAGIEYERGFAELWGGLAGIAR
jgi:DNA-binding PadR family transcriptional regulator